MDSLVLVKVQQTKAFNFCFSHSQAECFRMLTLDRICYGSLEQSDSRISTQLRKSDCRCSGYHSKFVQAKMS